VVLTYHQIRACQAGRFERQLELICRAGQPVWADATHITAGHRVIAITFDDGFDEALRVALPILEKKRIRSTWFVTTGYLGQAAGWIEDERHPNCGARLASMKQLKATDRRLVLIGVHTATHPRLPLILRHQVERELADPPRDLQKALGLPVDLLSLPYGEYCEDTLSLCRECGYRKVFGNVPLWRNASADGFLQGRLSVDPTDWGLELWLKLRGGYNWLVVSAFLRHRVVPGIRRQRVATYGA
jgi:peptidoglycan/xylan/chitin deacetylase (PgdA/CDA1 family)